VAFISQVWLLWVQERIQLTMAWNRRAGLRIFFDGAGVLLDWRNIYREQRRDPSRVGVKVSYLSGAALVMNTKLVNRNVKKQTPKLIGLRAGPGVGSPGCLCASNGEKTTPRLVRG
jgi:hypothetical protein